MPELGIGLSIYLRIGNWTAISVGRLAIGLSSFQFGSKLVRSIRPSSRIIPSLIPSNPL
jgi:hypothetical protein